MSTVDRKVALRTVGLNELRSFSSFQLLAKGKQSQGREPMKGTYWMVKQPGKRLWEV